MKKNKMMRLASVLLVLTLLTTSVISGTFAKYITSDSASDSARVAKWGINVLASGNLFGAHYNPNTATVDQDLIVASTANSVDNISTDGKDIVAPGTKNDTGFTVKISGTPEVAYKITAKTGKDITGKPVNEDIFLGQGYWGVMVEAKGLNVASTVNGLYTKSGDTYTAASDPYVSGTTYYELHDAIQVTEDKYFPIEWTVTSTDSTAISAKSDLTAIANTMVANLTKATMNANVDAKADYTLTWEWPFYTDATTDAKDTILGNLQASNAVVYSADGNSYGLPEDGTNYNLDIVFNFEVVVEQLD